jgi:hypothetical protein
MDRLSALMQPLLSRVKGSNYAKLMRMAVTVTAAVLAGAKTFPLLHTQRMAKKWPV